jgi:hypothetical protein
MGCDIHSFVEVLRDGYWQHLPDVDPFGDWRNYGIFGFLADVRNYSHSPVIAEPRGLPDDVSGDVLGEWYDGGFHSTSWLTVAEMQAYDYDQIIWDRRITREISPGHFNGAALAEEGEGRHIPLRDFLGESFFRRLDEMAALGEPTNVRMVFWFDN